MCDEKYLVLQPQYIYSFNGKNDQLFTYVGTDFYSKTYSYYF